MREEEVTLTDAATWDPLMEKTRKYETRWTREAATEELLCFGKIALIDHYQNISYTMS